MIPDDPGCTWVISGNFQNCMIFMKFHGVSRRRVLRTPSPLCNRECPKFRESQRVSESLRESERVSESLRESQRVSENLRESERVSESLRI